MSRTRRAIEAQPEWLRGVPTGRRLPPGRAVFTGCGTSFHPAQTAGEAVQALDAVLSPREADMLVVISHEGDTPLSLEAARAFRGPRWLVTGKPDSPLGELCEEVVVATPAVEASWCHTASYTCAVATLAALRGEDVSWLPEAVERVRAFVLEGEGRAAERAHDAVRALEILGCDVTLVPTSHPVVDIVPFQRLTVDLADAKGVNPDRIRRDDERWERASDAYQ